MTKHYSDPVKRSEGEAGRRHPKGTVRDRRADDANATVDRPCSCPLSMDHYPEACLYPNGCTGCTCSSPTCGPRTWCPTCEQYTVHPEQHRHAA
jgi:hypothetical protein